VIAIPGEVVDADFRIGKRRAQSILEIVHRHGHGS
jgi:hypothetical protein